MGSRPNLQIKLEELLGSSNVYYQPPSTIRMLYPAIVYNLSRIDKIYANDSSYRLSKSYEITVIDKNKDPEIIDKLLALEHCSFDRSFVSDNLNHYIFTIYY